MVFTYTDNDGTQWFGVPEGDTRSKPGFIHSTRNLIRVRRPMTDAEQADSERRAAAYARAMDHITAQWSSLLGALNARLPEGSKATIWQMGGMCMAIGFMLPDIGPEAHVMVTLEDDTLPHDRAGCYRGSNPPTRFLVGAYTTDDEACGGEPPEGRELYAVIENSSAGDARRDEQHAEQIIEAAGKLIGCGYCSYCGYGGEGSLSCPHGRKVAG